MTDLPNGWSYESINSIVQGGMIADGDWVESKDQDPNGQVRLTQLADVGDGEFRSRSDRWMNDEQALRLNVNYLQPGDLLMARMPDPLGRTCMVPENIGRAVTVVDVAIIRITRKDVNPKFVMWLLNSPGIRQQIEMLASGTTRRRITRKNLGTIDLPIPPINEQNKIVEILEDHLSRLDAALADVRSAKSKTSQLKFAILSKVFSGEFFEFDMPILHLEELAKVMNGDRGKNYPNKRARVTNGIPFINAGHLDNDLLNIEDMDFISEERYKLLAAGKVELNDLLFCLRGSLGKVAINDKFVEGAIASSLAILRVNAKVLPKYLYYYLLSPLAAIEIKKHDNGTAQPNLSAANLRKFEVPIPTIEQQKIVIDFLDSELSRTIQANQTFDSLFSTASAMRSSLLQSAITGQLTKEVASV